MSKRSSPFALLLLAASVPSLAMAVTPESCIGELSSAQTASEYRLAVLDLGDGFVMDVRRLQGDLTHDDAMFFTHCQSGGKVSAFTDDTTAVRGAEAYRLAASIMREAMASPVRYSLDDVAEQFRSAGLIADSSPAENSESCGCAAFYPEARGTKLPWIPQ